MPRATTRAAGNVVFQLRSAKGLTQAELARLSGLSKRQIERIEDGGATTLHALFCIATVLESSTSALEVPAARRGILERFRDWQDLNRRMVAARLDGLLSTSSGSVSIIVSTDSFGKIPLRLRPRATLGELTYAVAREYFPDEFEKHRWVLADENGGPYDLAMTVSDFVDLTAGDAGSAPP